MVSKSTFSAVEVQDALARVIEDIDATADLPEDGMIDILNFVSTAVLHYLESPEADLAEVAEENYGDSLKDIMAWFDIEK